MLLTKVAQYISKTEVKTQNNLILWHSLSAKATMNGEMVRCQPFSSDAKQKTDYRQEVTLNM